MRNIKRTIFYIECTLLKRPPSGRKVRGTTKSVSPRTYRRTVPGTVLYCTRPVAKPLYYIYYSIQYCILADQGNSKFLPPASGAARTSHSSHSSHSPLYPGKRKAEGGGFASEAHRPGAITWVLHPRVCVCVCVVVVVVVWGGEG